MTEDFLTKKQVAERLQRSERTITRWMDEGILPHLKLGTAKQARILFSWPEVTAALQRKFGVTPA
jgi:excisionase family DNA binding protein